NNCLGVPDTAAGATVTSGYLQNQAASGATTGSVIGGFIKIERQDSTGTWFDVTQEILNWGIGDRNADGVDCGDPSTNAIIRIQRLRDNGGTPGTDKCPITDQTNSYEWWPNVLFDTREGLLRDTAPSDMKLPLAGVMSYI